MAKAEEDDLQRIGSNCVHDERDAGALLRHDFSKHLSDFLFYFFLASGHSATGFHRYAYSRYQFLNSPGTTAMMRFWLFFGLLSVAQADDLFNVVEPFAPPPALAAGSQTCISQKLYSCQAAFNRNLNVTSDSSDWSNPSTLIYILRSYYTKSVDGFLSVCNARQQFAACLGDQYDACMSQTRFIRDGETPSNAYTYVQIFKTIEFDCDGGFVQSVQHWPCIIAVLLNNVDYFNQCATTFNQESQDPSKVCSASYKFENCMQKPYMRTCGPETAWWECERVRRSLEIDQKCPGSTCDYVASASAANGKLPVGEKVKSVFFMEHGKSGVLRELAAKNRQ
ncbi:unnamed protein product [Caenorhabditis auriculariae]|uniref:DUF19 domain-containing protein n=1 Tax=Caenorhabditis auriculariae TaxID=2777116 RepID=A0A8S1HA57_9PELO|nr:unnamed protein product [Caenorhabditis auriculariae]